MLDERDAAHAHLLAAGGAMATLAAEHGPVDPYVWDGIPLEAGDRLGGLALHITAQQISVVAALAIWGRFLTLLGGRVRAPALATATDEELRGVGMSGAKSRALRELGAAVVAGDFDPDGLDHLDDDEAQARLVGCAASARGRRRCSCCTSSAAPTCSPPATSACGRRWGAWRGWRRRRPSPRPWLWRCAGRRSGRMRRRICGGRWRNEGVLTATTSRAPRPPP
jgi:hypothetical protein